jgi:hypothetical protein
MIDLAELEGLARGEFADIVLDVSRIGAKLRMLLIDGSYIDFWWSEIQGADSPIIGIGSTWMARFIDTITPRIGSGDISRPSLSITIASTRIR